MKYSEIHNLQVSELRKRLEQSRQALFTAKMKHKMQRLSNMMELRDVRRDIARLETALSALPESAFVSRKSDKKKDEVKSGSKEAKKAKLKAVSKKQEKIKKVASSEEASKSKTKVTSVKKKVVKKEDAKEQKQEKQSIMEKQVQSQQKTKKWFGFFGSSQKPSSTVKDGGKRSFFRRKSGG
ncbi:MAG: 50S ribosomal protein L29 [Bdellovibrionales bacterium]|nr:50S ribosomal protein L29 [Bdellovibrionales bacterium]